MKHTLLKPILTFAIIILFFFTIASIYFSPVIEGKQLAQSDVSNYKGMAKEIGDYHENSDETILWTNTMFGGMPTYLILVPSNNLIKHVHRFINLNNWRPVNFVFVYLLGFFVALLMFGVNPWLSFIGAISFAFSSYFFIIIDAGHLTKVMAIGYMPPLIASFYYAYNKKRLFGTVLFGIFLSLQILVNHLQITYYTGIVLLVFVFCQIWHSIKNRTYKHFLITSGYLLIMGFIAIGSNFDKIWTTYEYGKDSMRGKSELTDEIHNKTTGLDKDYATAWSYGIDETLTLLIPNFKGGATGGALSTNSETYELFKNAQGAGYAKQVIKALPLYWGTQPFTSGPVYVGAFVFFLFVLSLFVLKGSIKWWLLSATILSILLAWGNNFMWFTELFLDYFPGYNKFRTVSMILVIAELTIPLMAILTLKKIINNELEKKEILKHVKNTLYIVGGICLFFALLPGLFYDFISEADQQYIDGGMGALVDALQADRKMLLQQDALRSLIFVFLGAGTLWFFVKEKIKTTHLYLIIGFLILVDLWSVDKRYLNNDDFVAKRIAEVPFVPTRADKMILEDNDPNFRVLNLSVNTFNDASTSYFHKSIGGYHGAKMKRYQELIDYHIIKNNMAVLHMLNTKYFIIPTEDQGPFPRRNPDALGNAWFVDAYKLVQNADSEIVALNDFNPAKEAIIDVRWKEQFESFEFKYDTTRRINLTEYHPNKLTYDYESGKEQMVVFSEIFYDKGWNAYVDGELKPHFRCNYVLRGMIVPAGKHVIEFKFEPKSYFIGSKISFASSILLILIFVGVLIVEIKKYLSKA